MRQQRWLAIGGLVLLAGCQSSGSSKETVPTAAAVAGSARIQVSVVDVRQSRSGTRDEYEFGLLFQSTNGVGAHFDRMRTCHVVDPRCQEAQVDVNVPASGGVAYRTAFSSNYNIDDDGYTKYFYGVDSRGNPVTAEVVFSTNMVQ